MAHLSDETDDERRRRFDAVVRSVYVPLQRYLRRRADAATAEDVLGDVLLVLWRRVADLPADEPLAWCYAVARGCLANATRGTRRHLRLVRRLAEERPPDGAEPALDPDLDAAFAALPPNDREVLRLWAWEGLPPREIAVVLGVTPNAASIRLHRATTKLRAALTDARKDPTAPGHLTGRQGTEAPR